MRNPPININFANPHDVRFLAVLDSIDDPHNQLSYAAERENFWKGHIPIESRHNPNVLVARIGGLYVGYLAAVEVEPVERRLVVPSRYEHYGVGVELLRVAAVGQAITFTVPDSTVEPVILIRA
jgi:hypothetical protein